MTYIYLVCSLSLTFLLNGPVVLGHPTSEVDALECPDTCECELETTGIYMTVNCTFRELDDIPDGTYSNTSRLILSDNNIIKLKNESFDGFENVITLDLKRNKIEQIEAATFDKLNLLELDLSDNLITSISYTSIQVQILLLDRNPIEMEDDTPGPILKAPVESVSLVDCGLSRVSENFFKEFAGVREVNLSRNSIINFAGAFQNLTDMRTLDLSRNNISEVTGTDALTGPLNLQRLILANNPLDTLDLDSIKVIQRGGSVDISDTPFVCECRHWNLYKWAVLNAVYLRAYCNGSLLCNSITTVPSEVPDEVCGTGPACVDPEVCCEKGECSKDGKCAGAAIAALPVAMLLLLASVAAALGSGD